MTRQRFSGVLPPILTPLKDTDTIDVPALKRHADNLVNAGCHGIFVAGSTGEGPNLSMRPWQQAIEGVVEAVEGRSPVYAGAIDVSLARVIEKLKTLGRVGADAAVVTPPFYFRHEGADLVRYFSRLADASPVDILLYNIPAKVRCNIPADVVRAASGTERIIGIKDSQGDWSLLQSILAQRTRNDFEVLCGSEPMMAAAMLCGADGIVPGSANFAPHLLIELYEAGRAKKVDEAFELQRRVERVRELLFLTGSVFVSMKTACKLLGICSDVTSFAYAPATPEQEEGIRSILEREGLLSKRAPGCA